MGDLNEGTFATVGLYCAICSTWTFAMSKSLSVPFSIQTDLIIFV